MFTPDQRCTPKKFDFVRDPITKEDCGWTVRHYLDETPGFHFQPAYRVHVQVMGGQWEDAADLYAAWGRRQWWTEKKTPRPDWLERMPVLANVHDYENYMRMRPAWFAKHQPEMNRLVGNRTVLNNFWHWERYGIWIAPDCFPPIGGEEAMVQAANAVRDMGNHLMFLFSCGQYWLHKDITDQYFNDKLVKMAVWPRAQPNRKRLVRQSPKLGRFVYMCPASKQFQDRLVHLVDKLADYRHEFVSMDIWPISQPQPCHNPHHDHPPGLGAWHVEANLELVKRLYATISAKEPDAILGGEGMAEPFLPWMQSALVRDAANRIKRDRDGAIEHVEVPMLDYIYGDQLVMWGGSACAGQEDAIERIALPLVRRRLVGMGDKVDWSLVEIVGRQRNRQAGEPLTARVKTDLLVPPQTRSANLAFLAKANDFQNGQFHDYFLNGRCGRFPEAKVRHTTQQDWDPVTSYSTSPALGTLRHPNMPNLLWCAVNPASGPCSMRVVPPPGMRMIQSTLSDAPKTIRDSGKTYVEFTLAAQAIAGIEWSRQERQVERPKSPNVLFIAIDDLFTKISTYGDPTVKMPNLDALADQGMLFERAYCQYPMCNPSRTSVITGLRPETTGILINADGTLGRIAPDAVTIPQHFSAHGYETVCIGKIMHGPQNRDDAHWDRIIRDHEGAQPSGKRRRRLKGPYQDMVAQGKRPSEKLKPFVWGPSGLSSADELDGRFAANAIKVLSEDRDKPLLLAVGFSKPHLPWSAPDNYFRMYPPDKIIAPNNPADDLDDLPRAAKAGHLDDSSFMSPEMVRESIAAYYACCTYVDSCIGQLLDALRQLELDKSTVVVLWSDHGFMLRDHYMWGKSRLFEEACHSPLLLRVPWIADNAGTRCQRLVELVDIFPTLVDLCGLPMPEGLEGTSMKPLLIDPDRPWKKGAFMTVKRDNRPQNLGRSVRTVRWRYSQYADDPEQAELYDHRTDPHEFRNLAREPEYAQTVSRLRTLLEGGWRAALPEGPR